MAHPHHTGSIESMIIFVRRYLLWEGREGETTGNSYLLSPDYTPYVVLSHTNTNLFTPLGNHDHFIYEETGSERLINLPKITE